MDSVINILIIGTMGSVSKFSVLLSTVIRALQAC